MDVLDRIASTVKIDAVKIDAVKIDAVGIDGPAASRRLVVDVRGLAEDSPHELRLSIVADVLRRSVELLSAGSPALIEVGDGTRPVASGTVRDALWIGRPAALASSARQAQAAMGGPADVVLTASGARTDRVDTVPGRRTVPVGPVIAPSRVADCLAEMLAGDDALAVRLALLRFPVGRPAALSVARLRRAQETLQRWQFKVACWADLPPAPAPPTVAGALRAAFGSLDTTAVLTVLHRLEVDLHVAAGSKFEAFAPADRVLGLDLQHLVGKLHR